MKKKNYKSIIDNIENTRKKNNKNWMDILRLVFESSPRKASKILSKIYKEDNKIKKGNLLLLSGFGVGYTWGACVHKH